MKMETTNPGGSSKDRPALEMILAAERDGLLQPGGTIVEPTSGNTGVGLAIVAAQRGYRCVFVMTDKVAPEKISLLGPTAPRSSCARSPSPPEDPQSYYSVAERLTDELRGVPPQPVRQPEQPAGPRADHRPRAVARRPAGGSPTSSPAPARAARSPAPRATSRRRTRTSRSSPPIPRARCSPAARAGRTSSRASARTSSRPRGTPELYDEVIADQRRGELPHRPAGEPRRGHPHRRVGRHGGRRGDPGRQARRARRHRRRAQPRLRPRLPVAGVRRRLDGQLRLPPRVRRVRRRRARHRGDTPTSCSTSTPTTPSARRST